MKRAHQRWLAFLKARLARVYTTGRRALTTDVDVTVETAESERAEAEAFARSAEVLRGGVAKIGQLRAYLDGSSADARARLATLWDGLPGEETAQIERVFVEDFGQPPQSLFARWEERPLAAASLGQVHAAEEAASRDLPRLAVKVQYPRIAEALRDDLASTALLRRIVGADLGARIDDEALATLRAHLLAELDYRREAENLERFRVAWAGDPRIVVPRSVADRSSARVLAMERLDGSALPALVRSGTDEERVAVATTMLRFALGSPLLHRCFNADPHPGNYLVLDAAAGRVGFVDFGCTVEIGEELHAADRKLLLSMIVGDGELLRHSAHLEGLVPDAAAFESSTWRDWERQLAAPFVTRGPFTLTPEHARGLVERTGDLLRERRMALPATALLLWRQRLGALTVIAQLRPRLDFRSLLADLLDDGQHPIPLRERYL